MKRAMFVWSCVLLTFIWDWCSAYDGSEAEASHDEWSAWEECTQYGDYTQDNFTAIKWSLERLFPDRPSGWMLPRNVTTPCKGTLYHCIHPDADRWKKKKQCSLRRGHLEPLGNQINDLKCLKHEYNFDPRHFVENYMRKQRPVILKGIAKLWPAFVKWGNGTKGDAYLSKVCNHQGDAPWYTNVEVNKKVKRSDRGPFMRDWNFCDFINNYQKQEWQDKLYVASQPVENMNMRKDIPVPEVVRCPEVHDVWQDITLWMNSGGGRAHFHFDTDENILFQIDGIKHTILLEPVHSPNMYMDFHNKYGLSPVDVDEVDLERFPLAAKNPYIEAQVEPGDGLYVPDSWWHTMHSRGRNIALAIHWQMYLDQMRQKRFDTQTHESLCASLTQTWSTGHMAAYAERLAAPWDPISKTCPKLRKRKLSHMVEIAQDKPDFMIDGYGVVRGDESDPTLGDMIS